MATKKSSRVTKKVINKPLPVEEMLVEETVVVATGRKITPRWVMGLILILVLLSLFWFKTNTWPVTAFVNGWPITRFEINQELYKQGGQQVLENLITDKLVQSTLAKNKIVVTDAEVTARINEIKQSLGDSFDTALAAQGMTMTQLKTQVATQIRIEKLLGGQASASAAEISQAMKDSDTTATEAEKMVKQQKLQELIQNWVTDLRAKAKVIIVGQKQSR